MRITIHFSRKKRDFQRLPCLPPGGGDGAGESACRDAAILPVGRRQGKVCWCMIVAQRLKAARQTCKLTQGQVAEILGIDRSAYTYYETGKTSPSLSNLLRLASVFQVEVAWLLGAPKTDEENRFLSAGDDLLTLQREIGESRMTELSKEERQLVAFYRAMKGEGKDRALLEAFRQVRDGEAPAEDGRSDD